MRLFYLINEPFEGYQTGYRSALNKLIHDGVISSVQYFSFIPKEKELGWNNCLNILKKRIIDFAPNIILVAHISKNHFISYDFINEINNRLFIKPIWVYDERDVYGYFIKPLSRKILKFASHCDLVTLVTYGKMKKRFEDYGAKKVVYLPHVYDYNFGTPWHPTQNRRFDIIMIANRLRSKIPFKSMPGIKEREEIVKKFSKVFGNKFAVFGRGWDKFPGNMGPINFFDQEKILRSSLLSIGMDHFPKYEGYYSDRLPIAIVSGVPHLTYRIKGVDKLFKDKEHVFYYESIEQAIGIAKNLLMKDKKELNIFGANASKYVKEYFSEDKRFAKMINIIKENILLDKKHE